MNGTQCKMARAAFGLSAAELASLAGIGRMTVVRFEEGENVAADSARRISETLEREGAQFSKRAGRIAVSVPNS